MESLSLKDTFKELREGYLEMPKRLQANLKIPPRKMVVLTSEQNTYVVRFAKKGKISESEAVRRIIQKARDDEFFHNDLLRQLSEG